MGLRQLYEKTEAEYVDYLLCTFDKCDENLGEVLSLEGGHALFAHVNKTDAEMKKIVEDNDKSADATFENKSELSVYLNESLTYKINEIANWFYEDSPKEKGLEKNKLAVYNYNHLVLKVDFGKEITGYGYKNDIMPSGKVQVNKYSTTAIRAVLTRSRNSNSQFGFYVETIYPDLCVESAIKKMEEQLDISNRNNFLSAELMENNI